MITVYPARTILTMDPQRPRAEAVAIEGGRIVAVGSMDRVLAELGDRPHTVDDRFAARVLMPGLIDQHLHPLLGATTLTTEVIAPEDWVMPRRTFLAAGTPGEYDARLRAAHTALADGEWLFTWGFHRLWHGELDRSRLDAVSALRPIAVWQRSCHEWYLNSAAIDALGITADALAGHGAASDQCDLARGHFWENGWMVLLSRSLMPRFLTEARFREGLHQLVEYLHMNGVTAINEPGISWAIEPWHLYQEILGAPDTPFESTFLVDGRTQSVRRLDPAAVVEDAERQVARAPDGKVRVVDRQVKLFADGAIISQLMQMREPYLDAAGRPDPDHHGEWIMVPDDLRRYFDAYWDAGWQIHVHVNGDLGLDVLLDVIEDAHRRHPRVDHRTVVVHFANSTEEQVARIARLGAIVSANPYYPVGFADMYGRFGLGPERADVMVRAGSVCRAGIPLSFHSDLPMGPADPLAMASFAVNRITASSRVAGPDQRIPVAAALGAVTIGAAHSWRREHELGSIEPGKLANLTVLDRDPEALDPRSLRTVDVLGTVYRGTWYPVAAEFIARRREAARRSPELAADPPVTDAPAHRDGCHEHGCGCEVAVFLGDYLRAMPTRAA